MTELDQALEAVRADLNDEKAASAYYNIFLNATFFVPTLTEEQAREVAPEAAAAGEALPLVVDFEGKEYLMIFDTPERLRAWTGEEVPFVEVPGHLLAATSLPPLHWALNVGTDYSRSFFPEDIAWLRQVVQECEARAETSSPPVQG